MHGLTLWHTSDSIAQEDDGAGAAPKAKGMFSAFTNLVSGKILDEDDLDPVLRTVKESLIAKNVAVDIAGECARAEISTQSQDANAKSKKPTPLTQYRESTVTEVRQGKARQGKAWKAHQLAPVRALARLRERLWLEGG